MPELKKTNRRVEKSGTPPAKGNGTGSAHWSGDLKVPEPQKQAKPKEASAKASDSSKGKQVVSGQAIKMAKLLLTEHAGSFSLAEALEGGFKSMLPVRVLPNHLEAVMIRGIAKTKREAEAALLQKPTMRGFLKERRHERQRDKIVRGLAAKYGEDLKTAIGMLLEKGLISRIMTHWGSRFRPASEEYRITPFGKEVLECLEQYRKKQK